MSSKENENEISSNDSKTENELLSEYYENNSHEIEIEGQSLRSNKLN